MPPVCVLCHIAVLSSNGKWCFIYHQQLPGHSTLLGLCQKQAEFILLKRKIRPRRPRSESRAHKVQVVDDGKERHATRLFCLLKQDVRQ